MKYIHLSLFLTLCILLNFTATFAAQDTSDNESLKMTTQTQHEIQTRNMVMTQAKMGELEITMEVIDEDTDSVADVTNTIELPDQIRERAQDRDRLHDDHQKMEGIQERIQEMHQQRHEMHNEIKEQQKETLQQMKEQTQSHGGGHGMGK